MCLLDKDRQPRPWKLIQARDSGLPAFWLSLIILVFVFVGCANPGKIYRQESETTPDGTHRLVSRMIADAVDKVDSTLGERRVEDLERKVRVRIGPRLSLEEAGTLDLDLRASARIPLPALERRANVFLEIGGRAESTSTEGLFDSSDRKTDYGAALSLIRPLPDNTQRGVSAGLFWNRGIQTFVRPFFRYEKRQDPWRYFAEQNVYYNTDKGWGEETRGHVDRLQGQSSFLRFSSSFELFQESPGVEVNHTIGFRHRAMRDTVIAWEGGANYNTGGFFDEDVDQDEFFAQVRWRGRLWRPWLEYELRPRAAFPWDGNQDTELSFGIELNVLFEDYLGIIDPTGDSFPDRIPFP